MVFSFAIDLDSTKQESMLWTEAIESKLDVSLTVIFPPPVSVLLKTISLARAHSP